MREALFMIVHCTCGAFLCMGIPCAILATILIAIFTSWWHAVLFFAAAFFVAWFLAWVIQKTA